MEIPKKFQKRSKNLRIFLLLAAILFLGGISLQGAVFSVNTTGDSVDTNPGDGTAVDAGGNCSLRAAIMEANALAGADSITIPAGTYTLTIGGAGENGCASGDLDIRSNLTINGAGPDATIIDGNQLDRVFHIKGAWTVRITNLRVRNGRSPDGVDTTSSLSLQAGEMSRRCAANMFRNRDLPRRRRFQMNEPGVDQREFSMPAALEAVNGGDGGGILVQEGTLTMDNCKIVNNQTGDGGSDSLDDGSNDAGRGGDGGGLCNLEGTVTISNSIIRNNTTGNGGCDVPDWTGLWCKNAGDGAGLCNVGGTMTLALCTVRDNQCGESWGHGNGGSGGGICNNYTSSGTSTLHVTDCTIKNNRTGDAGLDEGAAGCGGGIDNVGTAYIEKCLIHQNSCGEGGFEGMGGGICNSGTLYVTNSTISANSYGETYVDYGGGGLFNFSFDGYAFLESCTVTGNNHDGICNSWPDSWSYDPKPTSVVKIHNTIVANNLLSAVLNDCVGKIKSKGYNLIEGPSATYYCAIVGDTTGNIIGSDPNLGALANNGGPTQTHALPGGSPCIDTGNPGEYEDTDQRGVLRPKDGNGDATALPDMGAYEKFTPFIIINVPTAGAKVCGTILIEANTNTRYVDFKIDNVLLQTIDGAPHTCSWDTSDYNNGNHTIKAVGSDSLGGSTVQDQITVKVDNTVIALNVSRHEERAWLTRKQFGKVMFTVQHTGKTAPTAYRIERKEASGTTFSVVKEVTAAEMGGASYTYYDPLPNNITSYTYRVTVVDSGGDNVGRSGEQTI